MKYGYTSTEIFGTVWFVVQTPAQLRASKNYRIRHREDILAKLKTPENRARAAFYQRLHRSRRTPEQVLEDRRKNEAWCEANPERRKEHNKRCASKPESKAKRNARQSKARKENGESIRAYFRRYLPEYRANKRKTDPQFVIADRMRAALKRGLSAQGLKKVATAEQMVGCTMEFLKDHLRAQIHGTMDFNNPDTYAIDHFVPVIAFNLLDDEEQKWAFNWRNLQPLDPIENKRKSDKLPDACPSWLPAHIWSAILSRQP